MTESEALAAFWEAYPKAARHSNTMPVIPKTEHGRARL